MVPRIAITLGDPRGIGPEITAKALSEVTGATITVIGPDDLIAALPAHAQVSTGAWNGGSGPGTGNAPPF